jgi:(p)ppGpp synthase/HD superfamily hydrolase
MPVKTETKSHVYPVSIGEYRNQLLSDFFPLLSEFPEHERYEILAAFNTGEKGHRPQARKSGEPFIIHPIEVATILIHAGIRDYSTIQVALLHDVKEDTTVLKDALVTEDPFPIFDDDFMVDRPLYEEAADLEFVDFTYDSPSDRENERLIASFGHTVAHAVEVLSEDTSLPVEIYQAEIEEAIEDYPAVGFVKLGDRIHNIRTLAAMPYHKQETKIYETELTYMNIFKKLLPGFPNEAGVLIDMLQKEINMWKATHPQYKSPTVIDISKERKRRQKLYDWFLENSADFIKKEK